MVTIEEVSPKISEAQLLIESLDVYQRGLYPDESNHLDSVEELNSPHVTFLLAYHNNHAVGCGAVKNLGDYAEIKRVFVTPEGRGQGIAKKIMERLEQSQREKGIAIFRLETGVSQPEAIGLYEKLGYVLRGPFGDYPEDPLSVFMEKKD